MWEIAEREEEEEEEAEDQRNKKGDGRLVYWKGIGHGQMLLSLSAQDRLIEAMHCQAKESGLVGIAANYMNEKRRRKRKGLSAT